MGVLAGEPPLWFTMDGFAKETLQGAFSRFNVFIMAILEQVVYSVTFCIIARYILQ